MTTTHTPGPMEQWLKRHKITGSPSPSPRVEWAALLAKVREQDAIRAELLAALEPFAGIGANLPPPLYALYDGAIIRAQHAIAKARGA